MKFAVLNIVMIFLISCSASAAERMRIAIIDFEAKDISKKDAEKISELIRNEMVNTGKFTVIERAQMGQILNEQGLQQTGCTDVSCAVEIGKILSTRKILVGTVMKLAENVIITGRIVNVETGVVEFSEKGVAETEKLIYSAVVSFTKDLIKRIGSDEKIDDARDRVPDERKPLSYNPYPIPAYSFMGLSAASLVIGFMNNKKLNETKSEYDGLAVKYKSATSSLEAESLHRQMKDLEKEYADLKRYRNISYGAGIVSAFASGFFFYKYYTYPSARTSYRTDFNEIIPVFYTNYLDRSSISRNNSFFGGGVILRF